MKKELLRIDNGRLHINLYEALRGVYLNVLAGEALGILFANLYEKEAFIKVLRGDASFTSGRMYIDEKIVTYPHVIQQNIYVISRGTTLSDRLSIFENILFTKLPSLMVNLKVYREMLEDYVDQFHLNVDIRCPVEKLSHQQAISLELVKAYMLKKKIIVLADLSSYLTPAEMDGVLAIAAQLKKEGYGLVIIESFWDVIFKHTDNIAIIKHGQTTGLFRSSELGVEQLRSALWQDLGFADSLSVPPKRFNRPEPKDVALAFHSVSTKGLHDISFSLPKGKMLKVLYLDDLSRSDFLSLLRGELAPESGSIFLGQKPYRPASIKAAQRLGLCVVEGNPQEKMLLRNMTVYDNLAIMLVGRVRGLWFRRRFRDNLRKTALELCGEDLWDIPLHRLTPIQLQKVAYCKWLIFHPSVIVCINPFTGMDYQVDSVTERMMAKLLGRGTAVLIVSSYLPETSLPGQVYCLQDGKLFTKEEYPYQPDAGL